MVVSSKASKFLLVIVLSTLFISTSSRVIADSMSPINSNKQVQTLEEKRKAQGEILKERQRSTTVEGMLSSKDLEDKRRAEIEREDKIKREKTDGSDTYSEVVGSIRKLQNKKHGSKKTVHKETVNKEITKTEKQTPVGKRLVKKESATKKYYKNTGIPIIRDKVSKVERIPAGESVAKIDPVKTKKKPNNSIIGQLENIKDLINKPVPNAKPVDMDYSDRDMLERIVMAESGGEPYLGQIAVTNVILNRVKSSRYPSTLKEVIFQRAQFSPVKNGVIRGRAPNKSVKKAVAEALDGTMIVPSDTLYFVNPVLATDQTVPRTKTPVKSIGSHVFYK